MAGAGSGGDWRLVWYLLSTLQLRTGHIKDWERSFSLGSWISDHGRRFVSFGLCSLAPVANHSFKVLGAMSKSLATIATQPLIVAKVGLQSKPPPSRQGKPFKSFIEVMQFIVENEGLLGLFKGIAPQISKGLIVQGLLMMTKERWEYSQLLWRKYWCLQQNGAAFRSTFQAAKSRPFGIFTESCRFGCWED